jgi:LPXTG-motif cell wall-anchored protein
MFVAANVEIFGTLIGIIAVLIIVVYFARRKRA